MQHAMSSIVLTALLVSPLAAMGQAGPGGGGHLAFQLLDGVPEPSGGALGASACLLTIFVRHRTRTMQGSA